MGRHGMVWERIGKLYEGMGSYRKVWESMGRYVKAWKVMGKFGNV